MSTRGGEETAPGRPRLRPGVWSGERPGRPAGAGNRPRPGGRACRVQALESRRRGTGPGGPGRRVRAVLRPRVAGPGRLVGRPVVRGHQDPPDRRPRTRQAARRPVRGQGRFPPLLPQRPQGTDRLPRRPQRRAARPRPDAAAHRNRTGGGRRAVGEAGHARVGRGGPRPRERGRVDPGYGSAAGPVAGERAAESAGPGAAAGSGGARPLVAGPLVRRGCRPASSSTWPG